MPKNLCHNNFLQFTDELIGKNGLLIKYINIENNYYLKSPTFLQLSLIVLKCIVCLLPMDEKDEGEILLDGNEITLDIKEHISLLVVQYLMRGCMKSVDEFLYCKVSYT